MRKILFAALLFILVISITGCYTHLMLHQQHARSVEGDDYIVVEEPLDEVSEDFNDDYPIYGDYDSIWDWGFCFDPFRSPYYYPGYNNFWPWPVFYSYYYPYYYSGWYNEFYSGFEPHSYYFTNYTSVTRNKRQFDRREPFSRFTSTGFGNNINTNLLYPLNKNGSIHNVDKLLRIRKSVSKRRSNIYDKIRETYHKISKYSSSIENITEAVSHRTSSNSSSGTSSHSRSSSNSSGSPKTRK